MRNSCKWNKLRNKTLIVYPIYGRSLEDWYKLGRISYEVNLYNHLCEYFRMIYFVTYGGQKELDLRYFLDKNLHLALNTANLQSLVYSLIEPILHKNILKKAHVIKTYQILGAWSAIIAKLLYRKKLVVRQGYQLSVFLNEQHARLINRVFIMILEPLVYFFADCIIVTSLSQRKYIADRYHVNPKKIKVIPNHIDTAVFKPQKNGKTTGKILYVGRLKEQKNLFSLLESIIGIPCSLTIIGSGNQRNALERYSKEHKIDVTFLGNVPNSELPDIMNSHELFVLPSFYEGMPKVLLEAMACGMPVVCTNVDGNREVVKNGENGILCDTDSSSIKNAILKLLNNKQLQRKIGSNARATIEEHYSLERLLEKELNLYLTL